MRILNCNREWLQMWKKQRKVQVYKKVQLFTCKYKLANNLLSSLTDTDMKAKNFKKLKKCRWLNFLKNKRPVPVFEVILVIVFIIHILGSSFLTFNFIHQTSLFTLKKKSYYFFYSKNFRAEKVKSILYRYEIYSWCDHLHCVCTFVVYFFPKLSEIYIVFYKHLRISNSISLTYINWNMLKIKQCFWVFCALEDRDTSKAD